MADNPLEFLFTPGFQPSYDDPDGTKKQMAGLTISGAPGTIERVLPQVQNIPGAAPGRVQPHGPTIPPQELEFLNSLAGVPSPIVEGQGEFSKGISRGYRQLKADVAATGGTLASLFGWEDGANAAFDKYREIMADAAKYPAAVQRVEDAFDSPGAFVNWAAGMLGEQVPIVASIVATGGAGGVLGRLIAKQAISGTTAALAEKQIAQWGLRGATAGIVGGTATMESGGMTGEQLEAGVPVQPGMNLALGTVSGFAEAVSPILLGRMLGLKLPLAQKFSDKIAGVMAEKGLLGRVGTGALTIGAVEANTEMFQEVMSIASRKFADENYDALGPEAASRIINAGSGGLLVGGLFGGLGGIKRGHGTTPPPNQELPALGNDNTGGGTPTPTAPFPGVGAFPEAGTNALPAAPQVQSGPEAPFPGVVFPPAGQIGQQGVSLDPNAPAAPTSAATGHSMFGAIRQGHLQDPVILFGDNNQEVLNPDDITARTAEITEALTSPETRTPAHSALIRQVEKQRLEDFRKMFETASPSPELGRLLNLRSTLSEVENPSKAIEAKIEKLSEMIDQKAADEKIELPKASYLNEKENARLAYLLEKERTDGLTQKETDSLEKLMSKSEGEKPAQRVTATSKEISALENEVSAAMEHEGPLYKDTDATKLTGLSQEEASRLIAKIANPRIPLTVLEHPAQLKHAPELQKFILKTGRKVHGTYHNGRVYIFSRNLSRDNAVRVYLHEAAHYGLHNFLPEAELKAILNLVKKANVSWLDTYLEERGYDSTNPQNRIVAAEEYIARLAEDGSNMPLLRKIIAIIRRWLRSVVPDLKITDDEIRLTLQGLKKENRGPDSIPKLAPLQKLNRYLMTDDKYNRGYTMRIIDRLRKEKRENVTAKYVRQVIKEMKMNAAENHIIEEALAELGKDKFTYAEFEHTLKQKIVPLNPVFTRQYAAYRLGDLSITAEKVMGGATTIYEAPFETGGSHHFTNPNYVGHTRWVILQSPNKEPVRHVVEIQSDRSQQDTAVNTRDAEATIADIQNMEELYNAIDAQLKEIQNAYTTSPTGEINGTTLNNDDVRRLSTYSELRWEEHVDSPATPLSLFSAIRAIEEDLALQAADLDGNIQRLQNLGNKTNPLDTMYASLFRRMVHEEVRQTAMNGIKTLRIASAATVTQAEGWMGDTRKLANFKDFHAKPGSIIESLPNKYKIIAIRHNDTMKWFQKEYGAKLVHDENGFSWYEMEVPHHFADNEVMAYFSDSAQAARDTGEELGDNYTLAAGDIEKLSKLWRIKAETLALTPLQLVQRYGVEPFKRYISVVDKWARTKSDILSPADDVVDEWLRLPKLQANAVSQALFELTVESDEKGRRLTAAEEQTILEKFKLDDDALAVYKSVTTTFSHVLSRLENGLKYNAARETLGTAEKAQQFLNNWEQTTADSATRAEFITNLTVDPDVSINLVRRIQTIEKEIDKLRNRNYFPYMRFGKYTVTAKNAGGETTGFWTFESAKAQEEFVKSEEATGLRNQGNKLALSVLTDTQFAFLGMPPSFVESLSEELELSPQQKDQLKEVFIRQSPGRAFLRHLIKRKGIDGFSTDAMRVFSTYMMNASNHLARVENYADMDKALTDFKNLKYQMEEKTGDSRGLMTLFNALQTHRDYIMNPGNELANLRALGFMWYLGFNAKSAMVNMTQVPMVTYPYLAARYGDASTVAAIAASIKTATNVFRGKNGIDPTMDQLIARGIKEGFLDESLATELAGIAEGSTLARMMPVDNAQRKLNQFSYYGAFMFRNAEKFSRIIAFTAAAKLEMNKGGSTEDMFQAGKEAVRSTMFEYAKWNRPAFMRGKASVFFLFWTFMQNMAYISFGGQGAQTALRIWVMLGLMAGMQGLPFAENLLDILDFGNEKIRRALGLKGHYTDLRSEIRGMLRNITDNPDMIMHGLSRYWGMGPAHLLSTIGVPVPNVDTSGSLSMGRVLPGIKDLIGSERNPDEKFGRVMLELLGPVFGMPYAMWRSVEDNDPDSWKRFERAMPVAMKAASKAVRYAARGEEAFRGGGAVAKFDPHNTLQNAEIIAQTFGFTPTRITQRYDLRAAQQMMKEYFTVRRDMLLDEYALAMRTRDREAIADLRSALKNYNESVPHPSLRLDSETIAKGVKARQKGAQQRETLTPSQKMYRGPFAQVAQGYPESSGKLK